LRYSNVRETITVDQWLNLAGTGQNGVPQPVSGVPPPEIVVPPPMKLSLHHLLQLIAKWLRLDGPHCIFGQLIFGKIITIVASRGQILRLKCTKFYFGWGSALDPDGRAYSAPRDPLSGFKGPTSKGREE